MMIHHDGSHDAAAHDNGAKLKVAIGSNAPCHAAQDVTTASAAVCNEHEGGDHVNQANNANSISKGNEHGNFLLTVSDDFLYMF